MGFFRPAHLDEALSLLAESEWQILSGGTDFYPALGERKPTGNILDISNLAMLAAISEEAEFWSVGARATWADLERTPLPPAFDGLKAAGREVGSLQIQNRATIAGNLCNASPAADGVPPLLCLDALVELTSQAGVRVVPLAEFILGNRRTAIGSDELLTRILVPKASSGGHSAFVKLGARKYLVISIAMIAMRLELTEDKRIAGAAIAVGSCSEVAKRLTALEADLIGASVQKGLVDIVQADHLSGLSPIDDVRASGQYRLDAALELIKRQLAELMAVAS